MNPIHIDCLLQHLHSENDKIALGDNKISISYQDLYRQVSSISSSLSSISNNRIGILMDSSITSYAAILACWLNRKSYVPLSTTYPEKRIQRIIDLAKLTHIIHEANFNPNETNIIGTQWMNSLDLLDKIPESVEITIPNLNCEAYVLFTSGTTGEPKGVPILHSSLHAFVESFYSLNYKLTSTDRFLQMFELTFDLSIMSFLVPLTIGASFFIPDRKKIKPLAIYEILENRKITFALLVPSFVKTLEPLVRGETIESLKYTQFCGEALTLQIASSWQKICPNSTIDNVYGPTEATIYCSHYRLPKYGIPKNKNGIISIGFEMNGTKFLIHNKELHIGGKQLTDGYIQEELNKQAFICIDSNRYYKTGDFSEYIESEYYCLGRLDQQVKIQGHRVELSEIEHAFQTSFPESQSIALHRNIEEKDELILIINTIELSTITNHIAQELQKKLPHYMLPTRYKFITSWPLNQNGKIDRNRLKNEL